MKMLLTVAIVIQEVAEMEGYVIYPELSGTLFLLLQSLVVMPLIFKSPIIKHPS